MDAYDRAMLEFANRWCRFGGGDDHIFTEFGLSVPTFYRRVLALVESRRTTELDCSTKRSLRTFCTLKLSQCGRIANARTPPPPGPINTRYQTRPMNQYARNLTTRCSSTPAPPTNPMSRDDERGPAAGCI
ncbi:MAG: DUF3263 domain-containing protein [Comamonadaceae bacterium]|nr:MAG: DUF3263 domain-containing protein [Comamonadaceae bacterium]